MAIDTQFRSTTEHVATDTSATSATQHQSRADRGRTARPAARSSLSGFLGNLSQIASSYAPSLAARPLSELSGSRLAAMLGQASQSGSELSGKIAERFNRYGPNLVPRVNDAVRRHPLRTRLIFSVMPELLLVDLLCNGGKAQRFALPPDWQPFRAAHGPFPGIFGSSYGSVPLRPAGTPMFGSEPGMHPPRAFPFAQNTFQPNPFSSVGGVSGRFGAGRFGSPPFPQQRPATMFGDPQYYHSTGSMPTYGTQDDNSAPPVPPRPQNAQTRPATPPRLPDDFTEIEASLSENDAAEARTGLAHALLGVAPGASWQQVLGIGKRLNGEEAVRARLHQNPGAYNDLLMHVDDVEDAAKAAMTRLQSQYINHSAMPAINNILVTARSALVSECEAERANIRSAREEIGNRLRNPAGSAST